MKTSAASNNRPPNDLHHMFRVERSLYGRGRGGGSSASDTSGGSTAGDGVVVDDGVKGDLPLHLPAHSLLYSYV